MRQGLASLVIIVSLAAPVPAFDEQDTKSVVALELMDDDSLAWEAIRACTGVIVGKTGAYLGGPDSYRIASHYLQTIGLVLEGKNHGHAPQWYTDAVHASLGDDPEACSASWSQQKRREHEETMQKFHQAIRGDRVPKRAYTRGE
jgi:hypothetical protein